MIVGSTFSFIFEAMTWLAPVLLSGFLDRYPRLKMAIFESNAAWLPELLEHCDLLVKLYANERKTPLRRMPSEAFYDQCMISFEADEELVFRTYKKFRRHRGVGIGRVSSRRRRRVGGDAAHGPRRKCRRARRPRCWEANARRFYGIEAQMFVTEEAAPIKRPEWFPKEDDEFRRWWQREVKQENRY